MRNEAIDFVTVNAEDAAILARARVESIMRGRELFLTERELSNFHFALKGEAYVFQASGTKIIAERVGTSELLIKAFEKGAPRTVSRTTAQAIENYLHSKSLLPGLGHEKTSDKIHIGEVTENFVAKETPENVANSDTSRPESTEADTLPVLAAPDLKLIAIPPSSSCMTSIPAATQVIFSDNYWRLFIDEDLQGDLFALPAFRDLPVVFPPFSALAPDLSLHAAFDEDPAAAMPFIFTHGWDETPCAEDSDSEISLQIYASDSSPNEILYVETRITDEFSPQDLRFSPAEWPLVLPEMIFEEPRVLTAEPEIRQSILEIYEDEVTVSQNIGEIQDEATILPAENLGENERDIGLKIRDLITRMGKGYSADDVRKSFDGLNAIEAAIPGVLQGLSVPSFENACLTCFERILNNKNCFIDDLDEALLGLGVAAGMTEDVAKARMSERALNIFINGLSPLAGKPLKKSRAEKIRRFGILATRKIIGDCPSFMQAKKLVENIYEYEAIRTPKPSRDHDMIKLYSKLNDWFVKS